MKRWGMVSFIIFCIGLVVAIVAGLVVPGNVIFGAILAIFGLIIGLIYVFSAKEINTLLLATIALLAASAAFTPIAVLGIGKGLTAIVVNFAALMGPVALIAAIGALLKVGLEK